mmetsp:Transcript_27625/g.51514  ORF Transcript_27625/g.51514 Transcript_27625/m.51514 type:complete len:132 (-) Transcript_27625:101-496(-)|eukprot:CAMPEP_0170166714 /NCGR_PEP_ID=MMETSP0040_2-20121228/327_1 /TAXON_ID=641309 /ORGANISM="Lotharella oceanica, Strain CCMP622" /LENGTH=131 /DNA_ID=CAMNT_0010404515 /DNA_START=26 /DNA_END=421 /DNA_ORIENTATION=+
MIRGQWQLKKLVINYCKTESSRGVYDLMKNGKLVDFAKKNPQLQIVTRRNQRRLPYLMAQYEGNVKQDLSLKNLTDDEIIEGMTMMRNRSGRHTYELKHWGQPITNTPSVQGVWTPVREPSDVSIRVKLKE